MKYSVSIIGCGWLGLPLAKSLIGRGIKVKGSTTNQQKVEELLSLGIEAYHIELNPTAKDVSDFLSSEVLIINIPPRNKNGDRDFHQKQLLFIKERALESKVKHILFVSSTSVYPNTNNTVVEEDATYNSKSRAGISLLKMEDIFRNETGFSSTIIRFAGLIGPNRHPGNFFKGEHDYQGGQSPVNLIHLDDCIGIIEHILENDLWNRTFQACTPDHPTKEVFYADASEAINKKSPSFENNGDQSFKIVNSDKIINAGYHFKYSSLSDTI